MDPAIEQRFWKRIGVSSLHDLPDFPFGSHEDFVIAVRRGEVTFGITPGFAREYTEAIAVGLPRIVYFLLASVPFLLVPLTIGLAVYNERWAMLTGVLACLIPIILASPYNPNKNLEHSYFLYGGFADDTPARMAGEPRHEAIFDGPTGAGGRGV